MRKEPMVDVALHNGWGAFALVRGMFSSGLGFDVYWKGVSTDHSLYATQHMILEHEFRWVGVVGSKEG
jgi:hypothetical protein